MFPSVTFATTCWEKDWRTLLLSPDYLSKLQIAHHQFPFSERLLIINNVEDPSAVCKAAEKKVAEGVLTRFVIAHDILPFFGLDRLDFNQWQYYNALGPLMAIYEATSPYLLYQTGDVYLPRPVRWIPAALRAMEKKANWKVANLLWNGKKKEAKKESFRRTWNFFVAKQGFSDQQFLVRTEDFRAPIYNEIRPDANHFPRGGVWEARVFSFLKTQGWERITFRWGSYTHENL